MTVQVKSTEQHFTVVLFIVLYKLVIVFDPGKGLQMKAIEQFTPVVLFIVLHKVVINFRPVNKIEKCDHWWVGRLPGDHWVRNNEKASKYSTTTFTKHPLSTLTTGCVMCE